MVVQVDVEQLLAENVPVLVSEALARRLTARSRTSYLPAPGMTARCWTIPQPAVTARSPVPGSRALPSVRSMAATVRRYGSRGAVSTPVTGGVGVEQGRDLAPSAADSRSAAAESGKGMRGQSERTASPFCSTYSGDTPTASACSQISVALSLLVFASLDAELLQVGQGLAGQIRLPRAGWLIGIEIEQRGRYRSSSFPAAAESQNGMA